MPNMNDDDDLSTLDRGDTLPPRDESGRFTKAGAGSAAAEGGGEGEGAAAGEGEDKSGEAAADAADAATAAGGDGAAAGAGAEDAGGGEAEAGADDAGLTAEEILKQQYPLRLRKALDQRKREADARAAAEAERDRIAQELEALRKAAEKPAADPAADRAAALTAELDDLYVKVEEARADADTKLAAALQKQIDAKNRELATEVAVVQSTQAATQAANATREATAYNAMLDHIEATFTELQPNHEDFDADVAAELQGLVDAYEKAGLRPTAALRKATIILFRADPFAPAPAKPAAAPAAPAKPAARQTDVQKAIDTAKRQPPAAVERGVTRDDTTINPARLDEAEFNALPASKLRELRGDFVR